MVLAYGLMFFFVKQKTAYEMRISDWSSDVCSSDLCRLPPASGVRVRYPGARWRLAQSYKNVRILALLRHRGRLRPWLRTIPAISLDALFAVAGHALSNRPGR